MNFFSKLAAFFKKKYEHVFFFELPMMEMNEKEGRRQKKIRLGVMAMITIDLAKKGKCIEHVDLFQDMKTFTTSYTVASAKPLKQQRIIPLFYELYAYKKFKKVEIFSYKVEEKVFKISDDENIKVLSFKIEV
jgi:hypothetical protein